MLVIPDNALEYPEFDTNTGFLDNIELSDGAIPSVLRAFNFHPRYRRAINSYVVDQGFEPEVYVGYNNIDWHHGQPWFNGSSSWIELMVPHHIREDAHRDLLSVSIEFIPRSISGTQNIIGGETNHLAFRLSSGVPQVLRENSGVTAAGSTALTVGQKYTAVIVWDRLKTIDATNAWFLYINGELIGTSTDSTSMSWFSNAWDVGRRASSGDRYFNGMINNICFYSCGLSDVEIQNITQHPRANIKPV